MEIIMDFLTVKNLSFSYPGATEKAIDSVSFTLKRGEIAVLTGASASGKSTLLRRLKPEIYEVGELCGEILLDGIPIDSVGFDKIGFVMQRCEEAVVTDKVYSELAFGLESMGLNTDEINSRVAEIASYLGIEDWFYKSTSELSGGQLQLLSLASVMVMNPELLVLDEPTASLDPIAREEFYSAIHKLNRELSVTVLIAEHRLDELLPIASRLMIMENGTLAANGSPREIISSLKKNSRAMLSMPSSARLAKELGSVTEIPLTAREGADYLAKSYKNHTRSLPPESYSHEKSAALEFRDVCFRYERGGRDVLDSLSLKIYENEIFTVLGSNGSGKTTALLAACGQLKIYSGEIRVFGKRLSEYRGSSLFNGCLSMLPQEVESLFLFDTVRRELEEIPQDVSALPTNLSHLYDRHPYDLSGGEAQLVALGKILAAKPRLLLLDEPTRALDAEAKRTLADFLRKLKSDGITVVIVTHDIEFAAELSDRCALFFGGRIASLGTPRELFSKNRFFTTEASKISRTHFDGAVTLSDVISLCRLNGEADNGN